jgi:predicted transcriptional regulator
MQEVIERLTEQKGSSGGACSLEALKSRVRRNILHVLGDRPLHIDQLAEHVGVTGARLRYHLNFLSSSYFIKMDGDVVDLTPGGVSVVRSANRS